MFGKLKLVETHEWSVDAVLLSSIVLHITAYKLQFGFRNYSLRANSDLICDCNRVEGYDYFEDVEVEGREEVAMRVINFCSIGCLY